MPERPIDTLLALKALNFVEGLGENDRRVGATLIEHYNRETTRCDPGLERIAKLLGISGRTVIRCVYRLVKAGLFRKIRHGGNFNHNRYEPVWSEFQKIETEWKRRFSEKARSRAPEMSPPRRQPCHLPGDTPVTQTYPNNNLLNETCLKGLPTKERGETFRARVALTHRKQSTS